MEPENAGHRRRKQSVKQSVSEICRRCQSERVKPHARASGCSCPFPRRQRETPDGRNRHNQDEKERRKDLAARVDNLANVLGMKEATKSRSWTKIDVLCRAKKEIDVLKSRVKQLAEVQHEEEMRQERLKGELNGLNKQQPEAPPLIWRHELVSASSQSARTCNDMSQGHKAVYCHSYGHDGRCHSVPVWQDYNYYANMGFKPVIVQQGTFHSDPRPRDSYTHPNLGTFDHSLGFPQVFRPHAIHVQSPVPLVQAESPHLPPLMKFGIPSECFVVPPSSMTPVVSRFHSGSTDSEMSASPHMSSNSETSTPNPWRCSPDSSPSTDEIQDGHYDPILEDAVRIKREPTDPIHVDWQHH